MKNTNLTKQHINIEKQIVSLLIIINLQTCNPLLIQLSICVKILIIRNKYKIKETTSIPLFKRHPSIE